MTSYTAWLIHHFAGAGSSMLARAPRAAATDHFTEYAHELAIAVATCILVVGILIAVLRHTDHRRSR